MSGNLAQIRDNDGNYVVVPVDALPLSAEDNYITQSTLDEALAALDFPEPVIEQFVTNIAIHETFVTEVTHNETFVTELTENETFIEQTVNEITEVEENNTYITQITENQTFVTNITNQINGKKGQANELASLAADSQLTHSQVPTELLTSEIPFIVDGGGSAITTGVKGFFRVPFAHEFTGWCVLGDPSGSIVFDVWRGTLADHIAGTIVAGDSICASNKPTLSGARANEDTTITDWIEAGSAGAVYWVNVDSASSVTKATLSLTVRRVL